MPLDSFHPLITLMDAVKALSKFAEEPFLNFE